MKQQSFLGFRTRIALPYLITATVLVAIGLFSVHSVRNLSTDVNRVATGYLPAISEILNGDRDLYQALTAQMELVDAAFNHQPTALHLNEFNDNAQQAKDRFNLALSRLQGADTSSYSQTFPPAFQQWENSARQVIQLATSGRPDQARALNLRETQGLFEQLRSLYDEVSEKTDQAAVALAQTAARSANTSSVAILAVTLVALAASALLFVVFLRLIVQSITNLREQLVNLAQGKGDLTQRIPVTSKDDLGQLAASFNLVLDNLQNMIGSIQKLVVSLKGEAVNLEDSANSNIGNVTQLLDSMSMVAAAVNELHSAIEEVASNASQASSLTQNAEENGSQGAKSLHNSALQIKRLSSNIGDAMQAINRLAEDSANISNVLDVIRGIAEQTNLLALNAAIEAARAGEQGRGFAVVADEVRTLAGRTQESTEDIQTMISTLQNGVNSVVKLMEAANQEANATESMAVQTEAQLKSILDSISQIADVSVSVASAAEEQTQVVDEINRNLTQINDMASNGAEHSKDVSRISTNLADYSRNLEQQTNRFKV